MMMKNLCGYLCALMLLLICLAACGPFAGAPLAGGPTPSSMFPGTGLVKAPFAGEAAMLQGSGATFPSILYAKWFEAYAKLTNVKVEYQAVGSSGGVKALQDATVDFGATDGPMTDDQLKVAKGGDVLHIPTTLGAVVMTYNVPEAK